MLDLRRGRAVHARGGDRSLYRPLFHRFAVPEGPVAAGRWIMERWGPRPLYVADLDALEGGSLQVDVLRRLADDVPELWVDAAADGPARARELRSLGADQVVVGLETLPTWARLEEVAGEVGREHTAFSLDLRSGRPVVASGGPRLEPAPKMARRAEDARAGTLLVLDLERVGSGAGPDLELAAGCRRAAPDVRLLVGGGIGDAADLAALAAEGCWGCLVATALYGGELDPAAVSRVEGGGGPAGEPPGGRGG